MKKTEYALESFKNIQDLIKFIDQKTGAILVFAALIFTGFLDIAKNLQVVVLSVASFWGIVTFIAGILTLTCFFILLYVSMFKVLKPRLAKTYKNDERSLFYFEHLSCWEKGEVAEEYKNLSEDSMLKIIIDQQYEVAVIATEKTKRLKLLLILLFVSVVSLVIMAVSSAQI